MDWVGGVVGDIVDVGMKTSPIWSPFLPTPALRATFGSPDAPPAYTPAIGGGELMPAPPTAYPGGAPSYAPSVTPTLGFPGFDIAPEGSTAITPYETGGSVRLPSTVEVPYPTRNGAVRHAHYKNMGRPLLYSGDLAACKRVRKVGAKARSRSGGR